MTIDAQKIYNKLYSDASSGNASKASLLVYEMHYGKFPANLFIISSDKKYAAKLYLDRNPEDFGYDNYGFGNSKNGFKGIDIYGNAELYYNDSGIQIFNQGTVYSGTVKWESNVVEIEPSYKIAVPNVVDNLRAWTSGDSAGSRDTTDAHVLLKEALQSLSQLNITYIGNFNDYKFYNRGNGKYEIKTDSGYDDITGKKLLTFTGEEETSSFYEISPIDDIKATFDQVTGLNTDSGRMFRLYNASFKRLPDPDGLAYWIDNFSSGRNSIRVVASSFLASNEFKQRYGENVTDSTFVNTLYKNVLGRAADTSGLNYWLGQLSSGAETRYEALLGFAESTENKALFTEMTGFS